MPAYGLAGKHYFMANKAKRLSRENRRARIAALATDLPDDALGSLLEFAEFLQTKYPAVEQQTLEITTIDRPDKESVIAAIKRLSKTYPMLDKKILFEQTSVAMTAHVMQDMLPKESIDRLEAVFRKEYDKLVGDRNNA